MFTRLNRRAKTLQPCSGFGGWNFMRCPRDLKPNGRPWVRNGPKADIPLMSGMGGKRTLADADDK